MVKITSKRKFKSWFLLVIFLFTFSVVKAQQQKFFFKRLRTSDGLSHNKVNCILQDKRGFLWFGTEDGLNRYDGRYFTVFRKDAENPSSLSGNIVNDIYEDADGVIWIATKDGGLTRYDYRLPAEQMFKQFKRDEQRSERTLDNNIKKIKADRLGNLWLATEKSNVVRFNKKTEHFDMPVQKGTKGILALELDDTDTLWVGREGGGLLKIDTRSLNYKEDPRYTDLYAKLPNAAVAAIFKDSDHQIWCSSWDNDVYYYTNGRHKEKTLTKSIHYPMDHIRSFTEDPAGRIWMAGQNTGITVYDRGNNIFSNYKNDPFDEGSLIDNSVNAVYIDRAGTIWVGTDNGLSVHNPLFYPFKKHFLNSHNKELTIYDFFKDSNGDLLIGTSDGIYIKHPDNVAHEYRKVVFNGQKLAVTKFFKDIDGTFYIGTDYSLFKYNINKNQLHLLPNTEKDPVMKKIIDSRIVSIVRDTIDQHPVLMVSPYGHYFTYYDLIDQKWISRTDTLKEIIKNYDIRDHLIPKFYKDRDGLWIATGSSGLGYWKKGNYDKIHYLYNDPKNKWSIDNNSIYDIQGDSKQNLWVSTYGGGLSRYDKNSGRFLHVAYSSNLTEGLETDNHGNVWMISNGHVHKYEPSSAIYSCYDLPALYKTKGLKGYMYKDGEGNLYAGGDNYYVVFQPNMVKKVDYAPKVYLVDFKIFNQSFANLLDKKTIHLNYTQNYFSFKFSAPDFSGDNIQYAYMLNGFDKQWVDADKINEANYSNLPGGTYQFLVQARNWKGAFTGPYESIEIVITPPFWLRWWFYVLLCLFSFSIAYGIHLYRMRVRKRQSMIRNGIAQDLHDQIGSTLGSIAVYSEVAKIYQEQDDAGQLTEILGNIKESAYEMINEMADIVWALNSKNDHFASIITRIGVFAEPLCKAKGIIFELDCAPSLYDVHLEMKARKNLFLIVKEAIHNAATYAMCKTIKVTLSYQNNTIKVIIVDDGSGFDVVLAGGRSNGTLKGNGLHNMNFRAEELNGSLVIDSRPNMGTTILFTFESGY